MLSPTCRSRAALGLLLLWSASGCQTWAPRAHPRPGEALPGLVRVSTVEGEVVRLRHPALGEDSVLVGVRTSEGRRAGGPWSRHLRDIVEVEEEVVSAGATFKGVFVVGALLSIIPLAILADQFMKPGGPAR